MCNGLCETQWDEIISEVAFLFQQMAYHKVASSNTSRLEAHAGLFKIAFEGNFLCLCTVTFWQKVYF